MPMAPLWGSSSVRTYTWTPKYSVVAKRMPSAFCVLPNASVNRDHPNNLCPERGSYCAKTPLYCTKYRAQAF